MKNESDEKARIVETIANEDPKKNHFKKLELSLEPKSVVFTAPIKVELPNLKIDNHFAPVLNKVEAKNVEPAKVQEQGQFTKVDARLVEKPVIIEKREVLEQSLDESFEIASDDERHYDSNRPALLSLLNDFKSCKN